MALPPYPAIGTAGIELFGPPIAENVARWDEAVWDGPLPWMGAGDWHDVTPRSMNVQVTWGTDDSQGALSIAGAGAWDVKTYDPDRLLDPANKEGPFFDYLRPGGLIRLVLHRDGFPDEPVRTGFIDEVKYDFMAQTGEIRAAGPISLMVKAKLPAGLMHDDDVPLTLRARARYLLQKAYVPYVFVEENPPGELDPTVGLPIDSEASVWQQISTAAYDCLYAAWIDRFGTLRFKSFGKPESSGVKFGDALDGIAFDTLITGTSMESTYNHVVSRTDALVDVDYHARNQGAINRYGDLTLDRERHNPNYLLWADNVLIDRSADETRFEIGTIRPQTEEQLISLLDLGMTDTVFIYLQHGPTLNYSPMVLGGRFEANTDTGWSAGLTLYHRTTGFRLSPTVQQRRGTIYLASDVGIDFDGNGDADNTSVVQEALISPMAASGDKQHIILWQFRDMNFPTGSTLKRAVLRFHRAEHNHPPEVDRKEEGWFKIQRITGEWGEADDWPGPPVTSDGESVRYFESQLGEWDEIDITQIVAAWMPAGEGGGGGQPNYGIKISSYWGTLQPGQEWEHILLSGKLSQRKPYILATVEV